MVQRFQTKINMKKIRHVVAHISADKNCIWTSTEIFLKYQEHGGSRLKRRNLVSEIERHFYGNLLVLSSPGKATILAFKSFTADALHRIKKEEQDRSISNAIEVISKQVQTECKDVQLDRSCYRTKIDKDDIKSVCSDTLCQLLGAVSPRLDGTPPAYMISNIVTSQVLNTYTDLQIDLGISLQAQKDLIEHFSYYKVTCPYHEVR